MIHQAAVGRKMTSRIHLTVPIDETLIIEIDGTSLEAHRIAGIGRLEERVVIDIGREKVEA